MSEQAATVERDDERWYPGKNGGRLRAGTGSPGPRRSTTAVRKALVEALRDPRGGSGKEFFVGLKTGSAEDRRTFANVVTKLIPVEVQGDLGETLKIVINTFVAGSNGEPMQAVGSAVPLAAAEGESAVRHQLPIDENPEGASHV